MILSAFIFLSTSLLSGTDTLTIHDTTPPTHITSVEAESLCSDDWEETLDTPTLKNHLKTTAIVTGINVGLLAFDRYVLDTDFAKVTGKSIRRNLSLKSWYWDSDLFRTNMMLHPYHGSLYHNAARTNNLNFYQSLPYSVIGSLMWEIAGEMERPSINDFISTTFGGWAIGEATHRISKAVFDDEKRGGERIVREILGTAINPIEGIARLFSGQTFRYSKKLSTSKQRKNFPIACTTTLLARRYNISSNEKGAKYGGMLALDVVYGNPNRTQNKLPYDYFRASLGVDPASKNSIIGQINIIGQIKQLALHKAQYSSTALGIYQNFDYYATDSVGTALPYRISEAASAGIGLTYHYDNQHIKLYEELYLNGVLLGGGLSDYNTNRYQRDYSVGSGYSIKNIFGIKLSKWLHFRLDTDIKHLFSWHGYEDEDNSKPYIDYSVMGDRGNVITALIQPHLQFSITPKWGIEASALYIWRKFNYRYHAPKSTFATDIRLGLQYRL